jgi:hypothetical protein
MPRLLNLFSALVLTLLVVTPARAVSWDLIVTSAVRSSCPDCPFTPLIPLGGQLTVSDELFLRGDLFFSHTGSFGTSDPATIIGDTDFSGILFNVGFDMLSVIPSLTHEVFVDLSFSENGGLSGSIYISTVHDTIRMSMSDSVIIVAEIGSDISSNGCGGSAVCMIEGYWQLTSALPQRIPEPSALGILAGAITVLGILRRRDVLASLRPA